jgi:hypothetical protein
MKKTLFVLTLVCSLLVGSPTSAKQLESPLPRELMTFSEKAISALTLLTGIPVVWLFDLFEQKRQQGFSSSRERVVRGFRSGTQTDKTPPSGLLEVPWGPSVVPWGDDCRHHLIIGNTGQGKSTWCEVMMAHTLPLVGVVEGFAAVVQDPKGTFLPFAESLRVPYWVFNPLDERSVSWALGKDIKNNAQAREFVEILLESHKRESGGKNDYFYDAALIVLTGILIGLINKYGTTWQLHHLVDACANEESMLIALQHHPRPQSFDDYFKEGNSKRNDVVNTIKSKIDKYQTIAELWKHAAESISFDQVILGEKVLVLGSDYEFSASIKQVNSLVFRFLAARLKQLAGDNNMGIKPRFRVFIDEMQVSGQFDYVQDVLALGRSAGVSITLATQNISGWIREYGDQHLVKSIWDLCLHKALFGMGPDSAKWVSDQLGTYDSVRMSTSINFTPGSTPSFGFSEHYESRPVLTAQELMEAHPFFDIKQGLAGYFMAPYKGITPHRYSWAQINAWVPERRQDVVGYQRYCSDDPRLQIKPLPKEPPAPPSKKKPFS